MIKDKTKELFDLLKSGKGATTNEVFGNSYLNDDIKKIVKILVNECKCSLIDSKGKKRRYESDLSIDLVEKIMESLVSERTELNPTISSRLMSNREIIGPNIPIKYKKYNDELGRPSLEIIKTFPDNIISLLTKNMGDLEEKILKPYMSRIVKQDKVLSKRYRFRKHFNKYYRENISDDELLKRYQEMLSQNELIDKNQIESISQYFIYNILKNKDINKKIIESEINGTSLVVFGEEKNNSYEGMLHQLSINFLDYMPCIKNPNENLEEVKKIYDNAIGQLEALSLDIGQTPKEIEGQIKNINRLINRDNKNYDENGYRVIDVTLAGSKDAKFTRRANVHKAMKLYCEQVDKLLLNKDIMTDKEYIKEVSKLHFRFIQIHPFPDGNGRTGRAITNMLLSEKDMCALFDKKEKDKYIRGMNFMRDVINEDYIKGLYTNQDICSDIEDKNIYLLEEYIGIKELDKGTLYKDREITQEVSKIEENSEENSRQ